MRKTFVDWKIYRTRFLIKAKQLGEPLVFVDGLGRKHSGQPGDYLIESSDGSRSIQRREIFEDVYVAMGSGDQAGHLIPRREHRFYGAPNRSSASPSCD